MRRAARTSAASLFALFALASFAEVPARADEGAAAGGKSVTYTYELENADAAKDKVLVVWPRVCGSEGEPLGKVDLAQSPDRAGRKNDIDYDVMVKGKRHQLLAVCAPGARFYALPLDAFPPGTRAATGDDAALGQEAGAPLAIVPALDAIDHGKRIAFLTEDPRVLRSSFRFEPITSVRSGATLKAVHDIFVVDIGVTALSVVGKSAIYTYDDGSIETVAYVGAKRRAPSRGKLGDGTDGDAAASASLNTEAGAADASAGTGAPLSSSSAPPGETPSHDPGTRWIILAAAGGLVAGGLLAYRRRKAAPKA